MPAAREVNDQVPQLNPIWRLGTYTSHRIKIPSDFKQNGSLKTEIIETSIGISIVYLKTTSLGVSVCGAPGLFQLCS